MELEDEITLRIWRVRIGSLGIGEHRTDNGIRLSRPGWNRYVVIRNGERKEFGGRNTSVLTASLITLQYVTGIDVPVPCSRCKRAPRLPGTSHCARCRSALVSASNAKRRRMIAIAEGRAS